MTTNNNSAPVQWAKEIISSFLLDTEPKPPVDALLEKHKACFVTLHSENGALRGCIGTLEPFFKDLKEEIAHNAFSAAFKDPRFRPVTKQEWPHLSVSVDVLSEPEPVVDIKTLDPKKYGVIVSSGEHRGVLLPDLEGITDVMQQLTIAARKGGFSIEDTDISVERFTVRRYF